MVYVACIKYGDKQRLLSRLKLPTNYLTLYNSMDKQTINKTRIPYAYPHSIRNRFSDSFSWHLMFLGIFNWWWRASWPFLCICQLWNRSILIEDLKYLKKKNFPEKWKLVFLNGISILIKSHRPPTFNHI